MTYAYDPELAPFVGVLPAARLDTYDDLVRSRAELLALLEPLNAMADTAGIVVTDHEVPGPTGAPAVPVRTYVPDGAPPPEGRAAYLDIHGGGFVLGAAAMEHLVAVELARTLDIVVAVPEYRLAPETPFPGGLEDCYAALGWLHDQHRSLGIDPTRVAVGGQSAGGGLAAALALLARDRGGPAICFQLLGMPELDHRLETPSMQAFTDTPNWNRPNAIRSWELYLGPDHEGPVSPYASPAVADDLGGLPPAYVTAMEFDPLRDEDIAYAARLLAAGVNVELHCFPGTYHASSVVFTAAVSRRAQEELLVALRRGLRLAAPTA